MNQDQEDLCDLCRTGAGTGGLYQSFLSQNPPIPLTVSKHC